MLTDIQTYDHEINISWHKLNFFTCSYSTELGLCCGQSNGKISNY